MDFDNEVKYWLMFVGLFALSMIFSGADPCSYDDKELGLCEYNSGLSGLMAISCLGSFVPLGLAINERRKKGGFSGNTGGTRTVIVNKTPAQRVIRQTQQVRRAMPPTPQMPSHRSAPMTGKKPSVADQRKQAHLDRAYKMEIEGNLEGAITAYELAEEFREAQRVKWALGDSKKGSDDNGPGNVNISIGKIGDTSVQDSVVTGSEEEI